MCFDKVSRYRVCFLLNAEVCVLTVVTADSRTFEDHQITNSVGIVCHYGLACWGGGRAAAPCPIARYGLAYVTVSRSSLKNIFHF